MSREGKRYFRKGTIEATHTAGMYSGGMPPGGLFFKNSDRFFFPGKMQRCRKALQPAASEP